MFILLYEDGKYETYNHKEGLLEDFPTRRDLRYAIKGLIYKKKYYSNAPYLSIFDLDDILTLIY